MKTNVPTFRTLLPVLATAGLLPFTVHSEEAVRAWMPEKHVAVFETYCFDCHDSGTQKGKLDLETLSFEIGKDIPTAQHWQRSR